MSKEFVYELQVKELHLDTFGHINHATYLVLLEQARWEICNQNNLGIESIKKTGIGPVVLDAYIKYSKEVKNRENIKIFTHFEKENDRLFYAHHRMEKEDGSIAATAKLLVAIWNTDARKIIKPTKEWADALDVRP